MFGVKGGFIMTKGEFIEQLNKLPTRKEILAVEQISEIPEITSIVDWNFLNNSITNKEFSLELIDIPMKSWCNIYTFFVINMELQATNKIEINKVQIKDFLENDAFYVSEYFREIFKDTLENRYFQIDKMSFKDLKKIVAAGVL